MKKYLILALAVGLALVLIPTAMSARVRNAAAPREAEPSTESALPEETDPAAETISVYMTASGKAETLPMREYIICAVAGEMPAAYDPAALRAQALASVTLARYMKAHNRHNDALKGAVISTDYRTYQGYLTEAGMRERWGEHFEEYYEKISAAVDEVLPLVISFEGQPILAAFHAVSPGKTESAEVVWGRAVAYLVPCESEGDSLSPGFASSETLSPEALAEALSLSDPPEDPETWFSDAAYSDSGTLQTVSLCGEEITGAALREALSLRSAAISVSFDGENFVFDVKGYGHGVGMSQYGADYYARQGLTWQEIIAHYYPGTEIADYYTAGD